MLLPVALITPEVKAELENIRMRNKDQMLAPDEIVKASKSKKNPLHKIFRWDDDAGMAYEARLQLARQVVHYVTITIVTPEQKSFDVRRYVSLPTDRAQGRGYQDISTVMRSAPMREEMLQMAKKDLIRFTEKYQMLSDLTKFWEQFEVAQEALDSVAGGS